VVAVGHHVCLLLQPLELHSRVSRSEAGVRGRGLRVSAAPLAIRGDLLGGISTRLEEGHLLRLGAELLACRGLLPLEALGQGGDLGQFFLKLPHLGVRGLSLLVIGLLLLRCRGGVPLQCLLRPQPRCAKLVLHVAHKLCSLEVDALVASALQTLQAGDSLLGCFSTGLKQRSLLYSDLQLLTCVCFTSCQLLGHCFRLGEAGLQALQTAIEHRSLTGRLLEGLLCLFCTIFGRIELVLQLAHDLGSQACVHPACLPTARRMGAEHLADEDQGPFCDDVGTPLDEGAPRRGLLGYELDQMLAKSLLQMRRQQPWLSTKRGELLRLPDEGRNDDERTRSGLLHSEHQA